MDIGDIEKVIEACLHETEAASIKKYDSEKADRTAALFLSAQFKLSMLVEDAEMKAKVSKNEIVRLEGDKYFEYKTTNMDKKVTENMIVNFVAKDAEIVAAKIECAKYESALKKWNYILNILRDGHVYFRNLTKNKVWAE